MKSTYFAPYRWSCWLSIVKDCISFEIEPRVLMNSIRANLHHNVCKMLLLKEFIWVLHTRERNMIEESVQDMQSYITWSKLKQQGKWSIIRMEVTQFFYSLGQSQCENVTNRVEMRVLDSIDLFQKRRRQEILKLHCRQD